MSGIDTLNYGRLFKQRVIMKKKLFLLFLFFFLVFNDLAAQGEDYDYTFLNPGVRIGYSFGRGITIGVELSVGVNIGFIAGVATGIDYTIGSGRDVFRFYLEGELGLALAGIGFGGSLFVDKANVFWGRQVTIFGGWPINTSNDDRWTLLIPYYRVSKKIGSESKFINELGTLYKYSYPIGRGNYSNRFQIGS